MPANSDFAQLRNELMVVGFGERTPWAIFAEWLAFVGLTLAGVAALALSDAWWIRACALLLIVMGSMGMTTNAHTASHHAISKRRWVNNFFLYFGYPFFSQVSASYWRQKHLVIHHPHPNVVGVDNDADLAPVFALNQTELRRARGWHRWWYAHQAAFLPLMLVGNAFGVVFQSWRYLLRRLADPAKRSTAQWWDLAVLILHWLVWVVVPCFIFAFESVLMFTLLRYAAMSYAAFALFAPAHYPAAAGLYERGVMDGNFLMLQTATTINFRTGALGRLLCGGVQYQIEHHLFPSISPRHYPAISPIVRRFCIKHGYPYRTEGWFEAIWHSFVTFWRPKPVHAALPCAGAAQDGRPGRRAEGRTAREQA